MSGTFSGDLANLWAVGGKQETILSGASSGQFNQVCHGCDWQLTGKFSTCPKCGADLRLVTCTYCGEAALQKDVECAHCTAPLKWNAFFIWFSPSGNLRVGWVGGNMETIWSVGHYYWTNNPPTHHLLIETSFWWVGSETDWIVMCRSFLILTELLPTNPTKAYWVKLVYYSILAWGYISKLKLRQNR